MLPKYEIATPELWKQIERENALTQGEWLFLDRSEEFRGYWQIEALSPEFFLQFEDLIGAYRLVTPLGLDAFLDTAQAKGYRVVFLEDPINIIAAYEALQQTPPVSLQSSLNNVRSGFLPWQIVGFNKLIKDEALSGGFAVWTTGGGKTALIASAILYHQSVGHPFDLALIVAKSHNKTEMRRKLKRLGDIDSVILHSYKTEKRWDVYEKVELELAQGHQVVAITNYEKFREDEEFFKVIFKKRNLLLFYDEMPTRLNNPKTQIYKAIKRSLYESFYSKPRFAWSRAWALSATPIERDPSDVWACVNLLCPGLLDTRTEFETNYVAYRNFMSGKPQRWKNLDKLEAKISFMTHRVSKDDPEVAEMFPENIPLPKIIDWHPKHEVVYDALTGKATDLIETFGEDNILAMIQIMQMLCDAPSMVKESAKNRERFSALLSQYGDIGGVDLPPVGPKGSDVATKLLSVVDTKALTDEGHTKLLKWREIICEKHPHEKIVTHSTWAQYIFPVWQHYLQKWGVSYVLYTGTDKQKQTALDRFRSDPDIRVFLSGDSGSDSIDIPEARVGINYNVPWKATTMWQRKGRRDRVDSSYETIYTYTLLMANSIDERKEAVCGRKWGYHQVLFDGKTAEEAMSASLSREELVYLITGQT